MFDHDDTTPLTTEAVVRGQWYELSRSSVNEGAKVSPADWLREVDSGSITGAGPSLLSKMPAAANATWIRAREQSFVCPACVGPRVELTQTNKLKASTAGALTFAAVVWHLGGLGQIAGYGVS